MKNYDEVAAAVFCRRAAYQAARKKRLKVALPLAALCVAALVGVGVWQGAAQQLPPATAEDALYPGIPDVFDDAGLSTTTADTVPENVIVINQLDGITAANRLKQNICLLWEDFVPMNRAELTAYYGTAVFPAVPADLRGWEEQNYGIYRRDGGIGEVYWDGTVLNYSNEDFSRSVNIELKKGGLPITDIGNFYRLPETSLINGVEVRLGQSENYYFAQFLHNNVGFHIITEGLTQDEIVAVVTSLVA